MRELLKELRKENIRISLEGENLKLQFDQKQLPAALLKKLKANKQALIDYLKVNMTEASQEASIEPVPKSDDGYALSSAQMRMWILSQFEDAALAYNLPNLVDLEGDYRVDLMIEAISAVIDRHEILRTVFRENETGEVCQWVVSREDLDFDVPYVDLRGEANAAALIEEYVLEDNARPFDLTNGPLLRMKLFQAADDRYTFFYNMHHIISDGWSMGVLLKDVLEHYENLVRPGTHTIAPLQVQYKDYANWHQKKIVESGNADRRFWMDKLTEELPMLELPMSKERPKFKTYNGETLRTYLTVAETQALKNFSAEQEGSLFITLLSLWNVLLHRYASQQEFIIGSPVAGREHADLENQIGFYVNTLLFRNQVNANQSFRHFYQQVKTSTLEAYNHQSYPFDLLVDLLDLKYDTSRNAIFDAMLVLQNAREQAHDPNLDTNTIHVDGPSYAKFDMEVLFEEEAGYLSFKLDYNTDLFDRSAMMQLMWHFQRLAQSAIAQADMAIGNLDFLSSEEENQLLHQFNQLMEPSGADYTMVGLFQEMVRQIPEQVAIRFQHQSITYQELDQLTDQMAFFLKQQQASQNTGHIGVMLPRSEWLIVAILGIQKYGGAYVPIDPDYPEARKTYIQEDAACDLIVDEALLKTFLSTRGQIPADPFPLKITPDSLAYVIYTSGSTGKPKGVMIPHHSATSFLHELDGQLGYENLQKVAATTNITFDISILEIFGSLLNGKEVILFHDEELADPALFTQKLLMEEVEVLQMTPSRLQQLDTYLSDANLPKLKKLIVGGEAFSETLYQRYRNWDQVSVVNVYGPTETTIWSSAQEVNGTAQLTIGKPLKNEQLFILNDTLNLQPVGVTGQIFISGSGLAKGYWNRPELTAERFVPHPYLDGQRMYMTGDLGKWTPEGEIIFMGRIDDQVKIRGHRIELGEIAYHLEAKEGIEKAVVVVTGSGDTQELVAYFESGEEQTVAEIRGFLTHHLPNYMIPSYFVQLEEIPLMNNGKLNRKALPHPSGNQLATGAAYEAPRNEVEEKLVSILSQELGAHVKVGVHDNFFDLGANSLKLIRALQVINNAFDKDLKPLVFFQYPNIDALVNNIFYETHEEEAEEETDIGQELEDMMDLMED